MLDPYLVRRGAESTNDAVRREHAGLGVHVGDRIHLRGHGGRGGDGGGGGDDRSLGGSDVAVSLGVCPPHEHALSVLGNVESVHLKLLADAEAHSVLYGEEDEGRHDEGPSRDDHNGVDLNANLLAVAVKAPLAGVVTRHKRVGEEPSEDATDDAAHSMHAKGVQCIVVAEPHLELEAQKDEGRSQQAREEGARLVNVARPRRHQHQARDGAAAGAEERRLAGGDPLEEDPREEGGGGADLGDHNGKARSAVGREGGPPVEAEPADPEECGPHDDVDEVVGLRGGAQEAGAHDDAGGEAGDARGDVHDVAAREVHVPCGCEEAVDGPLRVADGAVDEKVPEEDEDEDRGELHALREAPAHDGRCDDGKGELEGHEDRLRDVVGEGVGGARAELLGVVGADEPPALDPAVDVASRGEAERVSEDEPAHGDEGRDAEGLHHGGEHVLLLGHAAVEERKARQAHHQDDGR
mmetsp:Transcript_31723/g.79849  ORF Transcript_31723/g.79849 Transcript_31723/m.79849 type:complete len:467 (-) Transcript_31723:168-1568(-)